MKRLVFLLLCVVSMSTAASCTNTCTEFVDLVATRKNNSCPTTESAAAIRRKCTGNQAQLERLQSLLQTCKKVRESSL